MVIAVLENLGAIEQRVYRSYWDDGLLDTFASIGVLAIGLSWMNDWHAAAAIIPAVLAPLWKPTRQRLIEPRLGVVEFTEDRERRNNRQLKLVLYFGIACLILGVETYFLRDRLGINPTVSLIAALPAFLLALMAAIVSVLVSTGRFVAYAACLVIAGLVGVINDWRPGPILALAGSIMLVFSIAVLAGFMRNNPREVEGVE